MDAARPTRAEAPPLMDGRSGLMRAALRGLMQPLKSDAVSLQVGSLGAGVWGGRSFYAPPLPRQYDERSLCISWVPGWFK